MEMLARLLEAITIGDAAGVLQIVVLVYMLRVMIEIKQTVDQTRDWHDVPDPDRPGAKLWWGLGIEKVAKELSELNVKVDELVKFARDRTGGG